MASAGSFEWPPGLGGGGGGGGSITIGPFSGTPSADGLTLTGTVLNLDPADATHPGGISIADWNTFNNKQSALTFGNLTDVGTDGIVVTGGTGAVIGAGTSLAQHVADATHNGYLSSVDWIAFDSGTRAPGSPNSFAGYSITGALEPIPGWLFDNTFNGANVNLTYDPFIGSITMQSFVSDFSPSANAAHDESGFSFLTTFDGQHLNQDNAGTITGVSVGQVMSGNATLDYQRALLVDQHSGNGTSTGVTSVQNLIEAYSEVTGGTTVVDAQGLSLQLNQNGNMTGNYVGINASANNQAIGANLTGISFVSNSAVGAQSTLLQLVQNGAVTQDFNGAAINSQGALGNNYFGLNISNSGTVAQNFFFLNLNNQNTGSIGNDFLGMSIDNDATVGHFFTGAQLLNHGTITKGLTGFTVDNTGNVGDGSGINLNAFNANLHGGSVAGGITGFGFFSTMPVTTNNTIAAFNANNSGAGYTFVAVQTSNNSNQTEEIRGFSFNSTGNSRTATLLDLNSNGTVTNDFNGIRVNMTGAAQNANGISVDVSNVVSSNQSSALSASGGASSLNSPWDTSVLTANGEFQLNQVGGQLHIAAGFPMQNGSFGFGNNLGVQIAAEDDFPVDSTGVDLGFSVNGFVNQVAVVSGKTFHTLNWMAAGAGIAPSSTGGTITNATMFRALGMLPEGGTIAITNMYGFKVDPLFDVIGATNEWGVWVGAANADNWFKKNVIVGGTSGQPTNTSVAIEVQGTTSTIRNAVLTTTQRNALTPLQGMQIWNSTTNQEEAYDGVSWVAVGAGADSPFGEISQNVTGGNQVVATGNCLFYPFLTVNTPDTYTLQTGSQLLTYSTMTVLGVLLVQGTAVVKFLM